MQLIPIYKNGENNIMNTTKYVISTFTTFANKIEETIQYRNWTGGECREYIKDALWNMQRACTEIKNFSSEEMDQILEDDRTKNILETMKAYYSDIAENHRIQYSDQECREKVKTSRDKMLSELSLFIPWMDMTRNDTEYFLFSYDEDNDIYLIPFYLIELIPNHIKLISINNKEIDTSNDDFKKDNDHRGGYLAYGIRVN